MYAAGCPGLETYFIDVICEEDCNTVVKPLERSEPLACLINLTHTWLCAMFSSQHRCSCRCGTDLHVQSRDQELLVHPHPVEGRKEGQS